MWNTNARGHVGCVLYVHAVRKDGVYKVLFIVTCIFYFMILKANIWIIKSHISTNSIRAKTIFYIDLLHVLITDERVDFFMTK